MIRTRLPVLGAIALLIFNCTDYVMPGCRDAASPVTFSNDDESEEQASLMGFCERTALIRGREFQN